MLHLVAVTTWAQYLPWVLGTLIYKGVKLQRWGRFVWTSAWCTKTLGKGHREFTAPVFYCKPVTEMPLFCILYNTHFSFLYFVCVCVHHTVVLKIFIFLFAHFQLSSQKSILTYCTTKRFEGIFSVHCTPPPPNPIDVIKTLLFRHICTSCLAESFACVAAMASSISSLMQTIACCYLLFRISTPLMKKFRIFSVTSLRSASVAASSRVRASAMLFLMTADSYILQ
jgi:hypothetical protein